MFLRTAYLRWQCKKQGLFFSSQVLFEIDDGGCLVANCNSQAKIFCGCELTAALRHATARSRFSCVLRVFDCQGSGQACGKPIKRAIWMILSTRSVLRLTTGCSSRQTRHTGCPCQHFDLYSSSSTPRPELLHLLNDSNISPNCC
jgi:hypothetical protein